MPSETWILPAIPSFCVQPQGGVAESIIQGITFTLREGAVSEGWVRAGEEHFRPLLIRPDGHLLPRDIVFLRFLKQWILQLRARILSLQNDNILGEGHSG